jgi:aspartate kinase/aspartokinase/homoserine dehydrogenase 1
MRKIVAKFGGSNLKKKGDILKLVNVIQAYSRPMVIVVSAFYGITNRLLKSMEEVKRDEGEIKTLTDFLISMKEEVIKEHFSDSRLRELTLKRIEARVSELERYLTGVHYIGEVPEFVEDVILSYGERLSSLLLVAILNSHGIDAEEALPEEMPLLTDGEYGNATVDYDRASEGVKNRMSADKVFVVPGFYGVSQAGKVTLLGRGGSDYSAAALARCLDAESLDVWKDVDGFMSADPKVVQKPIKIKNLTYTEAAELSYFGAGILHPRTVEPLKEKEIPIHLFNIDTFQGELQCGTTIQTHPTVADGIIKSVTYNDDFCILKLRGAGVGVKKGVLAKVTGALDRAGINIKSVITSQIAINLLLSVKDLKRAYLLIEQLGLSSVTDLEVIEQLSTIATVGEGLLEHPGIAGRIFSALAQEGINVRMIVSGASTVASYFIVSKEDRDRSIAAIHRAFF